MPVDITHDTIFQQLNELHSQLSENREKLAILSSKIELATPQNISNILIDIANLKSNVESINRDIKDLSEKLNIFDGKLNQAFLATSNLKNEFKKMENEQKEHNTKFFSWPTMREILVGVVLAVILGIGGNICMSLWESYLDKQAAKRTPQIVLTPDNISNNSK